MTDKREKELREALAKCDASCAALADKLERMQARAESARVELENAQASLVDDPTALERAANARRKLQEAEALVGDVGQALAQLAEKRAGVERELEELAATALAAEHGAVVAGLRTQSAALKAQAVGHLRGLFATLEERGEIQRQATLCYAAPSPLELLTEDELAHALADLFGGQPDLAFRALHNFIMAHATGGRGLYTDADAHLARFGMARYPAGANVVPQLGPTLIRAAV